LNDDALNKTLGEWQVTTPLPPRFRQQVWQRIERAEAAPSAWDVLQHWLNGAFAKPAFAVAYITALVFVGLTLGFQQARAKAAYLETTLGARYVQAVDPYQAPRN
jgi:hypothetical protein